ncbi:MAG: hypothetical protein H7176_03570 [Bdellovibrionales bacterium]|nr:hypothetical protein [Massilia sp.]
MLSKHLFSYLACAAALSGCATAPPPPVKAPLTIAAMMSEAEAAINLGKNEQGIALFKSAAAEFPREKAPRLRAAQVQFECHNYGEAIVHAREVLERDADDMVANSIMAASGLRVSSKALAELAARNNLTGSVRAEAQDLAKMLRENIKGPIIPLGLKTGSRASQLKQQTQEASASAQVNPTESVVKWLEKK